MNRIFSESATGTGRGRRASRRAHSFSELFDDYETPEPARNFTPFICEGKRFVTLHFNIYGVQSEMDPKAPDRLVLGYTRTMMCFVLFHPQPRHIGMVGLGGGSVQKYCRRHLPDARISVAEISADVIALRDSFCIPKDDQRFHIFCEDGADFVRRQPGAFDVLLVDGFDFAGQPPQLCSQEFYDECRDALTPGGVLVVNVCEPRDSLLIARIRRSFASRVLVAGGDDGTNSIVFAVRGDEPLSVTAKDIERTAASLRDAVPAPVRPARKK
jgi:spermidine synthase